ncbi:MAG: DUF2271 domain-containing protein [Spirochaetales bacterium]|nr:DUF2271 domain-containing protein [Spirochaetales bacterium]
MKNRKKILLALLCFFVSNAVFAQLTVTATTSTNNKRYSPRNVVAIWIQNESGAFVKNIQLRSASRTQHLYTWVNRSGWRSSDGYTGVDGWTGATRTSHGTVSGVWDLTDRNGNDVSFGNYTFWVEYTEEHAQGPIASGTIAIGPESKTINVQTSYINITADYKPLAVVTETPIVTQTPTPEVTATPVETATPVVTEAPNLLGDVNGDRAVNIVDSLLIAQHYVSIPVDIDLAAGDVDCSGSVNIVDSLLIAQLYVKLIPELPCALPTPEPFEGIAYYVAPDGNDMDSGAENAPLKTIQSAINRVQPGDRIFVKSGIYNEKLVFYKSGTARDYIILTTYSDAPVVLDGQGLSAAHMINMGNHSFIEIRGLEIRNNSTSSGAGIFIDSGAFNILQGNSIHHCYYGIAIQPRNSGSQAKGNIISSNVVYQNLSAGLFVGGVDPAQNGQVVNSHVYNNTFYSNDMDQSNSGEICLGSAVYNQFKSNLVYAFGQDVLLSTPETGAEYNVFDFNLYYAEMGTGNAQFIWNGQRLGNYALYKDLAKMDAHSVFENPLLISNTDFHLQAASPAIDAGNPAFAAGSIDFEGRERINGFAVDIGAYEYD